MKREEVQKERINDKSKDVFIKTLNLMIERKIISKPKDNKVYLKSSNETLIVFAASLIWAMLDSYYVTLVFTLSMIKNKGIESSQISKKI